MILDDGGDLTALMHKDYKELLKTLNVFQRNYYWSLALKNGTNKITYSAIM